MQNRTYQPGSTGQFLAGVCLRGYQNYYGRIERDEEEHDGLWVMKFLVVH